jgi:hypothetical protein
MSDTGPYPNRSDLRDAATRQVRFTGQTYGEGAAQARSQQAVPPGAPPAVVQGQQMGAQARPRPGGNGALGRPTERPDEPITAGADFGPGPNSMQAGIRPRFIREDEIQQRLIQLYRKHPNEGLRLLLRRYTDMQF